MSAIYSFYSLADGAVAGVHYAGDEPALNAPPGHAPLQGRLDPRRQRVALVVDDFGSLQPVVEPRVPPRPADNDVQAWVWDEALVDWVPQPTQHALQLQCRAERDRRMAETDWVTLRAFETGQPIPAAWLAYRAALRDVTEQPGFPESITWPTPPTP